MDLKKYIKLNIKKRGVLPFFIFVLIFVIGQSVFTQNNLYSIYSPGSVRLDEDSIFLYKFEDERCSPRRLTRIFSYIHLGDGGSPADIFFDTEGRLFFLDGDRGDVYQVDTMNGELTFAFDFDVFSGDYLPGAVADYKGVF